MNTKPRIVPDDIALAAQRALYRMPGRHAHMADGEFWTRVEYEIIGAILEERDRRASSEDSGSLA